MLQKRKFQSLTVIALICWLCFFLPEVKAQEYEFLNADSLQKLIDKGELFIGGTYTMGHYATGKLDTVKAEIVINAKNILIVKDGFIEREKYSYSGDRMPNGLPNNGGVYDDYYVTKRYLDGDKNEIKEYIWMARELGKK